jgi:cytochrome c
MLRALVTLALALAAQEPRAIPPAKRPRDPWVLRSVLDHHPRMVSIALSDEMWAAYDAGTCGLYKAWKGGVKFDGPVYTTVHGPQPTTQGTTYIEGVAGDVWEANVDGKDVAAMAMWRGYHMNEGHVVLDYEIVLEDGRKVKVQESPEFVRPEQLFDDARLEEYVLFKGHPGLLRSFLASDLPDGVKISLQLRTDGVTGKLGETLERERIVDSVDEKGEKHTRVYSHVALTKARPSSNLVLFFAPIAK